MNEIPERNLKNVLIGLAYLLPWLFQVLYGKYLDWKLTRCLADIGRRRIEIDRQLAELVAERLKREADED